MAQQNTFSTAEELAAHIASFILRPPGPDHSGVLQATPRYSISSMPPPASASTPLVQNAISSYHTPRHSGETLMSMSADMYQIPFTSNTSNEANNSTEPHNLSDSGRTSSGHRWTPNTVSSYYIPLDTRDVQVPAASQLQQIPVTANEVGLGSREGLLLQSTGGPQDVCSTDQVSRGIQRLPIGSTSTAQPPPNLASNEVSLGGWGVPASTISPHVTPRSWNRNPTSDAYSGAQINAIASTSTFASQQVPHWLSYQGNLGCLTASEPSLPILPSNGVINNMYGGTSIAVTFNDLSAVERTPRTQKEKRTKRALPYNKKADKAFQIDDEPVEFPRLLCRADAPHVSCNKPFASRTAFKNHLNATHDVPRSKNGPNSRTCPWEGCEDYLKDNSLMKHMLAKHGDMLER